MDDHQQVQADAVRAGLPEPVDLVAGFVLYDEMDEPKGMPQALRAVHPGIKVAGILASVAAWVFRRQQRGWPGNVYLAVSARRAYAVELRFGPPSFHRLVAEWGLGEPDVSAQRPGPFELDLMIRGLLVPLRAMIYDANTVAVIERLAPQR